MAFTAVIGDPDTHRLQARHSTRMRYRIVVSGELGDRYAPLLDGMTLRRYDGRTSLVGEIVDQSHLQGLIHRLSDIGVELISVNPQPPLAEPGDLAR